MVNIYGVFINCVIYTKKNNFFFNLVRQRNVARMNGNYQHQQPYQYLSGIIFPHADEHKVFWPQLKKEIFLPQNPNLINEQNVRIPLEANRESREKTGRSSTTLLQPIMHINGPNIGKPLIEKNSIFQSNQPRQIIYIDENGIFQVRNLYNEGSIITHPTTPPTTTTTETISTISSDAIIFELDDIDESHTADLRQNRQIDESKFYPTSNQSKDDWFIFT